MLPFTVHGNAGPTLVMLHWLGGSARTWIEVSEASAADGMTCVAIDLPGFGHAADRSDFTIAATANEIIETVRHVRANSQDPWLLVGHSMGGKFAAIVARAAQDGTSGLENLVALVLVSPSPPGPEPMSERTREQMLGSLGESTRNAAKDRQHAEAFVEDNVGKMPLPEAIESRAVGDVLRMNRLALVDWLLSGSREDWSERVGTVSISTLILAGTEEAALGPDAQSVHTVPHFSNSTLVALEGGGHLAPLERPRELAHRIKAFVDLLDLGVQLESQPLSSEFRSLIDSEQTSSQTRHVLERRLALNNHGRAKGTLSEEEFLILRSVAARILPGCPFDPAAAIQRWLAEPKHDGWRHASLPSDLEAWQAGLRSLDAASLGEHSVPFAAISKDMQDEILRRARDGKLSQGLLAALHTDREKMCLSASQMKHWFGDLTAQLIMLYMADPRRMARIGFTGFADEAGFTQIRLNQREDFEQ